MKGLELAIKKTREVVEEKNLKYHPHKHVRQALKNQQPIEEEEESRTKLMKAHTKQFKLTAAFEHLKYCKKITWTKYNKFQEEQKQLTVEREES